MRRVEPLLSTFFNWSMACHQDAALQDADFVGGDMDVEDPPPRGVRHAVEIAADAHRAFMRGPALQTQHRPIGGARQGLQ
jgi:hypothetical protein